MAQVLVNESSLEDIGDAIREKNESSDTYLPSEMGNAIRAIRTGGDVTGVKGDAESTYRTGNVNITPANIGAGTYSKPSGGIPKSDLASAVQTSLGKADTALQTAPVTSVNGNTGAVNITPANIGAKATQSAMSSPSASGTAVAFIDTITQNEQGVLTATKKTIPTASSSQAGLMSTSLFNLLWNTSDRALAAGDNFAPHADNSSTYPIKAGTLFTRRLSGSEGEFLYKALVDIANVNQISDATAERIMVSDLYDEIQSTLKAKLAYDFADLSYPAQKRTIFFDNDGSLCYLANNAADAQSVVFFYEPNLAWFISNNWRSIDSLQSMHSALETRIQGLSKSFAPNYYSGLFPVKAGQMVMYGSGNEKMLYRALIDIPTAEDFTAAHWEQVTVDELINVLEDVALAAYPTANTSGPVAAFTDGADDVPVKALTVDIASQTGVTGATLTRCGRNLIHWPALDMTSQNGVTAQITPNGKLSLSGTATGIVSGLYDGGNASDFSTMHLGPFPAGTYTITTRGFVGASANDYILVSAKYADNSDVRNSFRVSAAGGVTPTGEGLPVTFTATDSFKLFIYIRIASGTTMNCEVELQMEPGSALGTWEPYNGTTYTVDWSAEPGAITSGTLDVINSVLNTGGQDYEVTPVDVQTMLGNNTIYADCGDVSVTYRADPTLQHDNLDAGDVGFTSYTGVYGNGTIGKAVRTLEDDLFMAQNSIDRLETAIIGNKMLIFNSDGSVTWEEAPS